jgi:hypothetical protein
MVAAMRTRLPNRRQSETFEFTHEGHRYTACVGFDRKGAPAEVFLSTGKPGSGLEAVARDLAVTLSLGLQFGVPVDTLRHAVTRLDDGTAAGPAGKLLDLVAGRNG